MDILIKAVNKVGLRRFFMLFLLSAPISLAFAQSVGQADVQQDAETVVWGGVSLGSYADTPEQQLKAMPVIGQMLICNNTQEGCDGVDVNEVARRAFGGQKFQDFNVEVKNISVNQVQGYIITPVITSEAVVEAFEGKSVGYSYSYRIFGNLMILQFLPGEVNYVAAYPFILNYFDIKKTKLTEAQKQDVFRSLYLNNEKGVNYFDKLREAAQKTLSLDVGEHNYVQINSVELSDEVLSVLTKAHDRESWQQQIASFFEANLAASTGKPILPSVVGEQTTKNLQIVFRDGSKELVVPPAGYSIGLVIDRFLRHEAKSGSELIICFMVASSVLVDDPYGERIGDLRFARKRDSCGATNPGTVRADVMYFPESMYSLLYRISQQFDGKVDGDFLQRNTDKPAAVRADLSRLNNELFN